MEQQWIEEQLSTGLAMNSLPKEDCQQESEDQSSQSKASSWNQVTRRRDNKSRSGEEEKETSSSYDSSEVRIDGRHHVGDNQIIGHASNGMLSAQEKFMVAQDETWDKKEQGNDKGEVKKNKMQWVDYEDMQENEQQWIDWLDGERPVCFGRDLWLYWLDGERQGDSSATNKTRNLDNKSQEKEQRQKANSEAGMLPAPEGRQVEADLQNEIWSYRRIIVGEGKEKKEEFQHGAPGAMTVSSRMLFAMAANQGWKIRACESSMAFPQGTMFGIDTDLDNPGEISPSLPGSFDSAGQF